MVAQPSGLSVALRPRAFVRVAGPDAEDYLQRMVSNDVEVLVFGEVCDALLLTPKARVIATLRVWRRGADDFLLLTEPELGDAVLAELRRMRFAAKCEIEPEKHTSTIVFGADEGIPNDEYGGPAREVLDAGLAPTRELPSRPEPSCRFRPAAARACSRLRNRLLLGAVGGELPQRSGFRPSGIVVRDVSNLVTVCYLVVEARRRSVALERATLRSRAPVAQGIERCPAEAEVACSNHAGRIPRASPAASRP